MAYILPDSPFHGEAVTEEECVRMGGHCFERTGICLTSNPPQYPEKCRHCGKGRVAIPQEPWTYRDWP
jgi:hypothetical protein